MENVTGSAAMQQNKLICSREGARSGVSMKQKAKYVIVRELKLCKMP